MTFDHNLIVPKSVEKRHIIGGAFFAFLLLLYGFFPAMTSWQSNPIFNSPDETANYYFAHQWSMGNGLRVREPLNAVSERVVHPRSITVLGQELAPASFIGLPVMYGSVALFLGRQALPFIAPVLTVLALFALGACWRKFLPQSTATLAVLLVAMHPAMWYFTSRGFYPNVLFLDLVIFAWWGFTHLFDGEYFVEWLVFSVAMVAAALLTRASEALWLLPLFAMGFYMNRQHFSHVRMVGIVGATVIVTLAFTSFLLFKEVFFGYHLSAIGESFFSQIWHTLLALLFPFGFHGERIVDSVWRYGLLFFWPMTTLVIAGTSMARQRLPYWYFAAALWITGSLWFYYGSANIQDSVGVSGATIGNSLVRYWLPVTVVWAPYAAYAIESLATRLSVGRLYVLSGAAVLALAWGFTVVFFDRAEGLVYIAARLQTYRNVSEVALRATGEEAVIVSDRADKFFFPYRRVITPGDRPALSYPEVLRSLPQLVNVVPVYYYIDHPVTSFEKTALESQRLYLGRGIPLPNGAQLLPIVRL